MSDCGCEFDIKDKNSKKEKRVLYILVTINAAMFLIEASAGWLADSTGLLADSLDMFADALVYISALYVTGKGLVARKRSAYLSGVLQLVLGAGIFYDIIRRAIGGSEPHATWMVVISFLALAANIVCLLLLMKHKDGEIHMRATWIFTKNDVIANAGVIIAGGLVYISNSAIPDLVTGAIIAAMITKDSLKIFSETSQAK